MDANWNKDGEKSKDHKSSKKSEDKSKGHRSDRKSEDKSKGHRSERKSEDKSKGHKSDRKSEDKSKGHRSDRKSEDKSKGHRSDRKSEDKSKDHRSSRKSEEKSKKRSTEDKSSRRTTEDRSKKRSKGDEDVESRRKSDRFDSRRQSRSESKDAGDLRSSYSRDRGASRDRASSVKDAAEYKYKPKESREEKRDSRPSQAGTSVAEDDDYMKEPEDLAPDEEESDNISIDLMEHNALGYRYQTYQTGGPWTNGLMILWDLCFFGLSVTGMVAGFYLRFRASYWVITTVQSNPYYKKFKFLITEVDPNEQEIEFTTLIPEIAIRLIIYHAIYATCALGYMSYAFHKYQFTLPTFVLLSCLVTFAEVTAINVTYEPDQASRHFMETLSSKTKESYSIQSNDTHSISLDYISLLFQCCGIADHYDFQTLVLHIESPEYGGHSSAVGGCFNIFIKKIQEFCEWYSIITWLHLADIALHGAVYKQRLDFLTRTLVFKSDRQDAQMRHILRKRLVHEAMMLKKMVETSRVSN